MGRYERSGVEMTETMTRTAVCPCVKSLVNQGVLWPNLSRPGQYFMYPVCRGRVIPSPVMVKYCPVCGRSIRSCQP